MFANIVLVDQRKKMMQITVSKRVVGDRTARTFCLAIKGFLAGIFASNGSC